MNIKKFKLLTALLIAFLAFIDAPNKINAQQTLIIDHNNVNADLIPQTWLDQARQLIQFFNHKSIGNNILDGMRDLHGQNPGRYSINITYSNATNTGINDYQAGSNGQPLSKINGFSPLVKNGHNIAMMKFCTADIPAPCVSGDTPVETVWQQYREMMLTEQSQHPNTKLVWWTWPLIASNNNHAYCNQHTQWFNNQVRSYVQLNGGILFDLADIESHDPDGNLVTTSQGYQAAWPSYTSDGAHLNEVGRQRIARAWWWMMARVAGWTPDGVNPSPSASANTQPSASPSPAADTCQAGDADNNGQLNLDDLRFVLAHYLQSPISCADQNNDGAVNAIDYFLVVSGLGLTPPSASPHQSAGPSPSSSAQPISPSPSASSPIISQSNFPWGGFYAPHQEILNYGMKGNITNSLGSAGQIIDALSQAEAKYRLIVTVGSVSETAHPLDGTQERFTTAKNYFSGILNFTTEQKNQLNQYVSKGTLAAFRFYDEVHNAAVGGTSKSLTRCTSSGGLTSSSLNVMWIGEGDPRVGGASYKPGLGDLLYEMMKLLPSNTVVGSTSGAHYMIMVADRVNQLRAFYGQPSLADNSILTYEGAPSDIRSGGQPDAYRTFFECETTRLSGGNVLYFLANKSAAYGASNYDFFADYMVMCQVPGVDFAASWSWNSSPNFASRMADLADGGVTNGATTITLQDLKSACSR